jgi:hypothetical protein
MGIADVLILTCSTLVVEIALLANLESLWVKGILELNLWSFGGYLGGGGKCLSPATQVFGLFLFFLSI